MRAFLIALLLLLLVGAQPGHAAMPLLGAGGGGSTAGCVGYEGPGDAAVLDAAYFWGGLRAFSVATCGDPAINVCNAGDAACADMSTDATTGHLTVVTIGGTDCSVATCTVKTLYDQSGNARDITQATEAKRPTLVVSCTGTSKPCLRFTKASSQYLARSGSDTVAQPVSMYVAAYIITGTVYEDIFDAGGTIVQIGQADSVTKAFFYAGVGPVLKNDTITAWHMWLTVANGASSKIQIDTGSDNSNIGTHTGGDKISVGIYVGDLTANPADMYFVEAGEWAKGFSDPERGAIQTNVPTFWGY